MQILLCLLLLTVSVERIFCFECSNKCSQQDETLSCFNETQKYYGEKMIESICDYVTARLQFDRSTLNHPAWNYEQEARHNYAMNVDNSLFLVLDQSHFLDMMSSVEEQIATDDKTMTSEEIFHLNFTSCPTSPCDKQPEPIIGLFGASLVLNIVLILGALIYFVIQEDWNSPKSFLKRKEVKIPSWSW